MVWSSLTGAGVRLELAAGGRPSKSRGADLCVLQQRWGSFTSTAGKGIDLCTCVLQQRRGTSAGLASSVNSSRGAERISLGFSVS